MSVPYTHAMHATRCHQHAVWGVSAVALRVQVKKHGVTYCGAIAAPWTTPSGLDCWTVETISPEMARFTVPCKNVRECGDLQCSCVAPAIGTGRAELAMHEPKPEALK